MTSPLRSFPIVGLYGAPSLSPPGSTLASFQKALSCGATMLAAAVRSTADDVLVVDHEAMRRLNGQETALREQPWAVWKSYTADTDTPLVPLSELLALAQKAGAGVLMDLREPRLEGQLARVIRQAGLPMTDILVCAPGEESRRILRTLDPRIPLSLTLEADAATVNAQLLAALDTDAVTWNSKLLTPAIVKVLHMREIAVYGWDVDLLDEMRRLRDVCGVDGIVTRRPDLLVALSPSA